MVWCFALASAAKNTESINPMPNNKWNICKKFGADPNPFFVLRKNRVEKVQPQKAHWNKPFRKTSEFSWWGLRQIVDSGKNFWIPGESVSHTYSRF